MHKKEMGRFGESVARDWLVQQGWKIKESNFTIRGGELDIVAENDEIILCVEVKTIGKIDDIMAYITDKKLSTVKRTFKTYLWKYPSTKQARIDVIFVKGSEIYEVYENVTGT